MLDDLVIYQKTYDFILWLYPLVNKFPKNQRFVLGQRIENKTLDLVHSIMAANAETSKAEMIKQAGVELDELRMLVRLAKDLHFVSIRQYGLAADRMNEIGRLLSGWKNRFSHAI